MKILIFTLVTIFVLSGCSAEADSRITQELGSSNEMSQNLETEADKSESDTLIDMSTGREVDIMVAEPMESVALNYDGANFIDLHSYADGAFSCTDLRDEDGYFRCWADGCEFGDFALLETYVELLCSEYEFSLVSEPYYLQDDGYYRLKFDFVLKYTGDAYNSDSSVISEFSKNSGDLVVSGFMTNKYAESEEKRELHARVEYAKWLTPIDDGARYGKDQRFDSYAGASFGAGLNRLKDGSYQTTDGRLSAAIGEAMFLTDGAADSYKAWFEWSNKDGQKRICVENKFGLRQMNFNLPITQPVASGDIFTAEEVFEKRQGEYESMPQRDTMFALLHGQYYQLPTKGLVGEMSRFNARMMYYDEDEAIAVFYFCAHFRTEPSEMEGLAAVSLLVDADVSNPADADYVISVGESVEIDGPSEFGAGYNLWTWEYLKGSEISEMHNTISQTCTVIGRKPGTVRIKVTYEYSVKEPDVLTGIESSQAKSDTQEYVIVVK